jgi:hypothetical protein
LELREDFSWVPKLHKVTFHPISLKTNCIHPKEPKEPLCPITLSLCFAVS